MAIETACQTPGATFHTRIARSAVAIEVSLPFALTLTASEAKLLEANLHNAAELVLAPYFRAASDSPADS